MELQEVKTNNNIPYLEARKIVEDRTPVPGESYASMVKKSFATVSTQTEELNRNQSISLGKTLLKLTASTDSFPL